jgi:protein-tyrosine phosphatase
MWWFSRKEDLPTGMVDLHNHLSPGIDDGAQSDEDTLDMLRVFIDTGFSKIAITSHLCHPMFPDVTAERIRERVAHVQALVAAHQLPIEVVPGSEIYYQDHLLEKLEAGELVPLGGEGNVYLIEFPPQDPMVHMKELGFELSLKGIRPVLAHPERYTALQRKPSLLHDWRRAGWAMQLDIASLMGSEGRAVRKLSEKWLQERGFDLAASDMHRPLKPEGQFRKMLERLLKQVGREEATRLLVHNPDRLLSGTHLLEAEDADD